MKILRMQPLSDGGARSSIPALSCRAAGGFPSPAADHYEPPISLDELLELRAPHIWLVEAEGTNMSSSGIMNRSRLVVDRAREALAGDVIVAFLNNEPVVKRLAFNHGEWSLISDNVAYAPILVSEFEAIDLFGVVTWSLTCHV